MRWNFRGERKLCLNPNAMGVRFLNYFGEFGVKIILFLPLDSFKYFHSQYIIKSNGWMWNIVSIFTTPNFRIGLFCLHLHVWGKGSRFPVSLYSLFYFSFSQNFLFNFSRFEAMIPDKEFVRTKFPTKHFSPLK